MFAGNGNNQFLAVRRKRRSEKGGILIDETNQFAGAIDPLQSGTAGTGTSEIGQHAVSGNGIAGVLNISVGGNILRNGDGVAGEGEFVEVELPGEDVVAAGVNQVA